ncbi:putative rna-binding protein [Erysiphe neolycopersici]|uniref:Putative rna-binding protein n=1 Tax=Erysiphe neolycopersici TaxID=212602 RepID=A0A420HXX5_9PEZI|nr:putative rna-binding protein [Erysiphe neolycopersici]
MSYSNNTTDHIDDLRFRNNQHSPISDQSLLGMVSPSRTTTNTTRLPQSTNSQDSRGALMRRFTTDSGRAPAFSSGSGQRNSQEVQDYGQSTYHKVQLLEKKKLEYERLREQKRLYEAEMKLLDLKQRRDEQELAQMQEDLGRCANTDQGHQSQPTTPPEFSDSPSGFPSAFSRPNRYSTSSLTSPSVLFNSSGRSGAHINSPTSNSIQSHLIIDDKLLSKQFSEYRRTIDDDDKAEAVRQDPTSHRSTNALNRYSMPVTKTRPSFRDLALDQINTARFLFGEEESSSKSGANEFLQVNANEENFPILVRREDYPNLLSASSAALDLALCQIPAPESTTWNSYTNRHRSTRSQQGISLASSQPSGSATISKSNAVESSSNVRQSYRHSLDTKFRHGFDIQQDKASQVTSPSSKKLAPTTSPSSNKIPSSFSNDIQNTRSTNNGGGTNSKNAPSSRAQQRFHNHNASLGRIPPGAISNILSRDVTSNENPSIREGQNIGFQSMNTALHASAPSFGPASTQNNNQSPILPPLSPNSAQSMAAQQSYYGMQMIISGMQNMPISQYGYSSPNPYGYSGNQIFNTSTTTSARPQQTGSRENQARVSQNRRPNDGDNIIDKYANVSLESLDGEIYSLCKDQHGCRYLQKKLEERNPDEIHQIWLETNQHVIEFMTDPFGNYLCQKLLEYCNDSERTILIENASHDLVRIALNQHGTRALQKMIEHITTQEQIDIIINALRYRVVELIQDLNGNHVIQKCLNKLSSKDAQFIFDAVGKHCVEVGTHRHGCCVLQRCIDHADGEQKAWLIHQISNNAYTLMQDPFGNYVVQYICDLNEPIFTEPLAATLKGRVSQFSKHKFSSNVVEKCLRFALEPTRDSLIEELLQQNEIDRLLRDSFGNYVIQTALDYASPDMKARLIEAVRPHLPPIRSTPHGRRIQAKISGNEARNGSISGQSMLGEQTDLVQLPLRHSRGGSTASSSNFLGNVGGVYVNGHGISNSSNNAYTSNRSPQSAGSFPSSEQLASPINQNSNSYNSYDRGCLTFRT